MKVYACTLFILALSFCQLSHAQVQTGKASFYADKFEGRKTASGEKYKHSKLTAAHKTLPFGTKLKVTNMANGKSIEVVVNDRGPYVEGRVIDLSKSAARELGFINQGLADVKIEILDAGDGKGKTGSIPRDQITENDIVYYAISVEQTVPKGYGVQLATFKDQSNLLSFTENLSIKERVFVEVKQINGQRVFALIGGPFKNYTKANEYKTKIKADFPDSFIVDFSK